MRRAVARAIARAVHIPTSRSAFGRSGRFVLAALLAIAAASCGHRKGGASSSPAVFPCGEQACDARTSYCEMIKTDYAPLPSTYTCKPLPASCLQAGKPSTDCGCFPKGTRCDFCSRPERNGVAYFQRTCIGGY